MTNSETQKNRKVAYSAGLKLLNDVNNQHIGGSAPSTSGIPDNDKLITDYAIVLDEVDNVLAGDLLNNVVYEVLASLYNTTVIEVINRHKPLLVQKAGSLPLNPSNYTKLDKSVENTARILGINQYYQNIQIIDSHSIRKKLRNIL